jgi:hypothetical protein
MSQTKRIAIVLLGLIVVAGAVVAVDALRGRPTSSPASGAEPTLAAGAIPIRVDGVLLGGFSPADLEGLAQVSFVDAEEGKTQEGWMLRDVLLLHVKERELEPETLIVVSSSSRDKLARLTWAEVDDPANWVLFDLSGRGTLKLVSVLERLDIRDEWVQDVDKIVVIHNGS